MALLREPKSGTFTEDLHAPGLLTFVETVFGCLPRTDQPKWAMRCDEVPSRTTDSGP
ncbi:hypothetical protein OG323_37630 (plasmid) [Streptomyces cyaneofuscatus]|uniref:hypothetical protein n=1 Tax=Streptomyces cyaneofuscatus TaxID=66883 RepID=UPI002F908754|nr:hypothetical protein OG323_37630 [Streptomyces cyaneofuscatus]